MSSTPCCPVCGSGDLETVLRVEDMPALCNAFAASAEEALAMPRGDIELVSCRGCGMLFNACFDPALAPYDSAYENSLHFSPRFQEFAEELADGLARRYGVPGGTVVEIGSGGGDFLGMVASRGFARGVGIDPSLAAAREDRAGEASLTFLPGTVADAPAGLQADLVVCRHVLEHVPDPVALLRDARRSVGREGTGLYVEVPDAEHMLAAPAVWDLIYEHVGYFTDSALRAALASAGWAVTATGRSFGNQYRWAEAIASPLAATNGDRRPATAVDVERFNEVYAATLLRWNRYLDEAAADGRRVAVWGAGSKGVAFANAVAHRMEAFVDINERKHGRFVPGIGGPVCSPSQIVGRVDTVLVMNPLYLREVEEEGAAAGLEAVYLPVE